MSFVVVYDACVLYPVSIRDLLMRLASTGLFQARWTEKILDECFDNLVANRPELKGKLERTRRLMNMTLPDAVVHGYETLVENLELPDENDRHVLAAAIRAGAQVIVTANLKDFPDETLAKYDIEAQDPDTFTLHLLSLNAEVVIETITVQAVHMRKPPCSVMGLLELLERHGLVQSVKELRNLMATRCVPS